MRNMYLSGLIMLIIFNGYAQSDMIGSGRAIQFDGIDDYIDLGNIYDDINLPVSISAWIYVDPGATGILPIMVSQDNEPRYNGFWLLISSTKLTIEYGDGRGENLPAFRRKCPGRH